MAYQTIIVEIEDGVALVRLNRPEALNALSPQLLGELAEALTGLDADDAVRCIILTGSEKAFAAGADIKEMVDQSYQDVFLGDWFAVWDQLSAVRTPIIAAVSGYALGGGCELAMLCDIIIAADTARFGQPEINLGTLPGIGGSQRLTKAVGKAKAMDLLLTGRQMDAEEAERAGLVSRVVPVADLLEEAGKVAEKIAGQSLPALYAAKEAVNVAFETPLAEGVRFERRTFHASFAFDDRSEGMKAFSEKRAADFQHR